jgi:hypothetical protein
MGVRRQTRVKRGLAFDFVDEGSDRIDDRVLRDIGQGGTAAVHQEGRSYSGGEGCVIEDASHGVAPWKNLDRAVCMHWDANSPRMIWIADSDHARPDGSVRLGELGDGGGGEQEEVGAGVVVLLNVAPKWLRLYGIEALLDIV